MREQYLKPATTIAEVQAYERKRDRPTLCGHSCVQPLNCIVLNSELHAGVVSHVCAEPHGHQFECTCACGYQWLGGQ